ncbi:hypothetical protein ABH897_005209 [Paenibacillus sp. RC73]|uniref:hypothetical protein n=1 Tax=Paenibacillus sp. RC73 TaxID=3156250 RepID=UPI0038353B79
MQDYIRRYQQEDDQECLQLLLENCWPYVETLIGELITTTEMKEDIVRELWQKGKRRFPFIMSKYQLEVQLPLQTFLYNTYRFYFRQVLNGQG